MEKETREEKIRSLGFMCYNLNIDGEMAFPEVEEVSVDINKTLENIKMLRGSGIDESRIKVYEDELNGYLVEMGTICCEVYRDNELYNTQLIDMCREIEGDIEVLNAQPPIDYNVSAEPVSADYKECPGCRYKNKPIAKFCGMCGTRLP